jgi:hypothetical protein
LQLFFNIYCVLQENIAGQRIKEQKRKRSREIEKKRDKNRAKLSGTN